MALWFWGLIHGTVTLDRQDAVGPLEVAGTVLARVGTGEQPVDLGEVRVDGVQVGLGENGEWSVWVSCRFPAER